MNLTQGREPRAKAKSTNFIFQRNVRRLSVKASKSSLTISSFNSPVEGRKATLEYPWHPRLCYQGAYTTQCPVFLTTV